MLALLYPGFDAGADCLFGLGVLEGIVWKVAWVGCKGVYHPMGWRLSLA